MIENLVTSIHPTAIVDPKAELDEGVKIGPYCIVEADVRIGKGTSIEAYVAVQSGTTIGERNTIAHGAIIGGAPQDRKYQGQDTYLKIGDENVIREFCTIHRATGEGNTTIIGNRNYLMSYCHVGHNVALGDDITMANSVGLSGHVTIENLVTIGGMTGIHQFVRVGTMAMVAGFAKIVRDVPPYMLVQGAPQDVVDINAIGLRRIGISQPDRLALHKACKFLFKSGLALTHAIEIVEREVAPTKEVQNLVKFLQRIEHGKGGRGDQR